MTSIFIVSQVFDPSVQSFFSSRELAEQYVESEIAQRIARHIELFGDVDFDAESFLDIEEVQLDVA
jgi:hypothetical protein